MVGGRGREEVEEARRFLMLKGFQVRKILVGGDLPLGWSNLFWLQVFSQGRVHICLGLFVCMCV